MKGDQHAYEVCNRKYCDRRRAHLHSWRVSGRYRSKHEPSAAWQDGVQPDRGARSLPGLSALSQKMVSRVLHQVLPPLRLAFCSLAVASSDKTERACKGCWSEAFRPPADACPFLKSYPDVLMVQSNQDRNGDNGARSLDRSMQRCIFLPINAGWGFRYTQPSRSRPNYGTGRRARQVRLLNSPRRD